MSTTREEWAEMLARWERDFMIYSGSPSDTAGLEFADIVRKAGAVSADAGHAAALAAIERYRKLGQGIELLLAQGVAVTRAEAQMKYDEGQLSLRRTEADSRAVAEQAAALRDAAQIAARHTRASEAETMRSLSRASDDLREVLARLNSNTDEQEELEI